LRPGLRAIVKNDIFDIDMAMKIDVLTVDGVFDTGLAAVLDAFTTANELAAAQGLTSVSFEVTVVGLRRRVRSKQGCTVPVSPALGRAPSDWVPLFRQRYPRVRLEDGRMLVRSGRVLTAGAALSHMDMALWLIRQASPSLAALTARYLIVDSRPTQSAYAMSDHLAHADPLVQRFERWARDRLANGFSLDEAAHAIGASKRTLARRINDVLGKSPLSYFQDLRVERAVHLLRTSSDDVEKIAAAVGYADGVTLRNLLRRKLGRGVREIRSERAAG